MRYSFKSNCNKSGNRLLIKIPFNVWETCGKKGLIPVEVDIEEITFECKLIPKGNGEYVIPVKQDVFCKLPSCNEYDVHFNIIDQLKRINNDSPYNKNNPIRYIDHINYLSQPQNGCCGQTCLAMLAGVTVDEVIKIMNSSKWHASLGKVIETLDYFGFSYKKPVYTHGQKVKFPKCCIINTRSDKKSHLLVHFDGVFYDPSIGIMYDYQYNVIISYIEIISI